MAKNTVRVNVIGDASSLKRSMGEAGKATEGAGKKMSTFAKVAVTALAVQALRAVSTFVKGSIESFVNLNESLNALEVTYGEHADGIKRLGEQAARNLGISNAEFNNFAVSISAFAKQIAGDSGDVVGVVDELTQRVTDFASVMNIDVAEAQEKFQSGLAGQSRPLREYGIDVSDARVKLFALENGIGDATGKLTEAEKVQARYGTIMEQTDQVAGDFANTQDDIANKSRTLEARLEDQKAIIGQGLAPAYLTWLEAASTVLSKVAELTGAVTAAERAMLNLEGQTDATRDSAQSAATLISIMGTEINDFWGEVARGTDEGGLFRTRMDEIWESLDIGAGELKKLADAGIPFFIEQLNLTEEQAEALADILAQKLADSVDDAADSLHRAKAPTEELTVSQAELEAAADEATDAMREQADELRAQTDPLFAVHRAQREVSKAKRDYTEALKEGGPGSDAAIDAAWELTRAEQSLDEALIAVRDSGMTRAEFEEWHIGMGRSAQEASNLADNLEKVQGFVWPNPTVKLKVDVPTINYINDDGRLTPFETGRRVLARGGVGKARRGGIAATIAEGGDDEAVIPLNQRGIDAMSKAVNQYGGGGGPAIVVINHGSIVTQDELINAIHDGLLKKQKRSGGLGLAG